MQIWTCSKEMGSSKEAGLLCVCPCMNTRGDTCFSRVFCWAFWTGGLAAPGIPRERQIGWSHLAAETCLQSTTWSRPHSEMLQGTVFYLLSPALNAGMCLVKGCLPGKIPSVFQVWSRRHQKEKNNPQKIPTCAFFQFLFVANVCLISHLGSSGFIFQLLLVLTMPFCVYADSSLIFEVVAAGSC